MEPYELNLKTNSAEFEFLVNTGTLDSISTLTVEYPNGVAKTFNDPFGINRRLTGGYETTILLDDLVPGNYTAFCQELGYISNLASFIVNIGAQSVYPYLTVTPNPANIMDDYFTFQFKFYTAGAGTVAKMDIQYPNGLYQIIEYPFGNHLEPYSTYFSNITLYSLTSGAYRASLEGVVDSGVTNFTVNVIENSTSNSFVTALNEEQKKRLSYVIKKEIRNQLESKKSDFVVGCTPDPETCSIGNYLSIEKRYSTCNFENQIQKVRYSNDSNYVTTVPPPRPPVSNNQYRGIARFSIDTKKHIGACEVPLNEMVLIKHTVGISEKFMKRRIPFSTKPALCGTHIKIWRPCGIRSIIAQVTDVSGTDNDIVLNELALIDLFG